MDHKTIIESFYSAFARGDAEGMIHCYHDNIEFNDPAFGPLKAEEAKNMWRMLLSRNKDIRISFSNVQANANTGSADWEAEYVFTPTGRNVINRISAQFEFMGDKIIKHTDHFNMWKWSSQALGWKGSILGWTPFLQKKIQGQARQSLSAFMKKRES